MLFIIKKKSIYILFYKYSKLSNSPMVGGIDPVKLLFCKYL